MTKQTRVKVTTCRSCEGTGILADRWCDECDGKGVTKQQVEVEVSDEFIRRTQESWGDFSL